MRHSRVVVGGREVIEDGDGDVRVVVQAAVDASLDAVERGSGREAVELGAP